MTYLKTPLAGFVAGATLAGMLAAGNVGARELSFASGATPNSIGSKSIEVFTNALEERSDGDLTAMPSLTPEGVSEKLSRDWGNTLALRGSVRILGQRIGEGVTRFGANGLGRVAGCVGKATGIRSAGQQSTGNG